MNDIKMFYTDASSQESYIVSVYSFFQQEDGTVTALCWDDKFNKWLTTPISQLQMLRRKLLDE